MLICGILIAIIGILMIFFSIPRSKTQTEFAGMVKNLIVEAEHEEEIFQEADMAGLPAPVQRYFKHCGYLGTAKMSYIKLVYEDVEFSFGRDKPRRKIDYLQYNFVDKANRIAYIDSSMYGCPFEGLDTFIGGSGSMKGVVAKLFTLFDQSGTIMDTSSLVTFLSEILIIPNAALQDYIIWEAIDDLHAKATITCYGSSASGIFTFNEDGEVLSFLTDDRSVVASDGSSEAVQWSAIYADYLEVDGVKRPTAFQAIWHYDDGDLVYFDGKGEITAYH